MASVVPGYVQHVVPVPHAGHGQVVHDCEVKKSEQTPCAHTWLAAQAVPQLPAVLEQWSGLDWSCASV